MQKTHLLILAIILVFGVGFLYMRGQVNGPNTTDPATNQVAPEVMDETPESGVESPGAVEETADDDQAETPMEASTVMYTDTGFSPAELTVEAGTEVMFVNQSSNPMWVASDSHPAHNDYPDFDQLSGGDEYSYTFTEAGTYAYHNHLMPADGGVVVVE